MTLTLSQIEALIAGAPGPVHVGEIPYDVGRALELRNPNVYLARATLLHIFKDHPEMTRFELLRLPEAIRHGLLIQEKIKPQCILVSYLAPDSSVRFFVPMKIANQQCEVWVSSFYRSNSRQTRAKLKRGVMLKPHD